MSTIVYDLKEIVKLYDELPADIMWKAISDSGGKYVVSNYGHVVRMQLAAITTHTPPPCKATSSANVHRYLETTLYLNGKSHWRTIHRLVATEFVPNPQEKHCVNHIEWCTVEENKLHAIQQGLNPGPTKYAAWNQYMQSHRKAVRCVETGQVYKSIAEARRATNLSWAHISESIARHKMCKGLTFVLGGVTDGPAL